MGEALVIYQDTLDRLSKALWDLDFDTLLHLLTIPNWMITEDAKILLDSEEDICRAAQDFRGFLDRAGAQAYHRIASEARFHPGDRKRIDGVHKTFILRGGQYSFEPYRNTMQILCDNGVWRGTKVTSHVRNSTCTIISPSQMRARFLQRDRNTETNPKVPPDPRPKTIRDKDD